MAWEPIDKTWHDTTVDHCDVCGNLLIRRAWVFTTPDGRRLRACREDDEQLHARLQRYAPQVDAARAHWASNAPVSGTPEDPDAP
jgi:hypothetical protein